MQSPFTSRELNLPREVMADPEREQSTAKPGSGRGYLCTKPGLRPRGQANKS